MALKSFVKISNVNNLGDARYCAGMYVNLIGFCLEESNLSYLSPENYKEITEWLSGTEYVAEFEFSHPEVVLGKLQDYPGINFIEIQNQFHLPMLLNSGYKIILKQNVDELGDLENLIAIAEGYNENNVYLLLESNKLVLDEETKSLINNLSIRVPVLLGFGINEENVEKLTEEMSILGIGLMEGNETKAGFKDFDELADILEALEIED